MLAVGTRSRLAVIGQRRERIHPSKQWTNKLWHTPNPLPHDRCNVAYTVIPHAHLDNDSNIAVAPPSFLNSHRAQICLPYTDSLATLSHFCFATLVTRLEPARHHGNASWATAPARGVCAVVHGGEILGAPDLSV